jgi:TrmH family RNA methyltransferase
VQVKPPSILLAGASVECTDGVFYNRAKTRRRGGFLWENIVDRLSRARLKSIRALRSGKARRETGLFLVEGVRACEAFLDGGGDPQTVLLAEDAGERANGVALALGRRGAETIACTIQDIRSVAAAQTAQGILVVADWHDRDIADLVARPPSLVLALDGVGDPGNVGAVVRAADWFGAGGVVLANGCADLLNPKTVRATAGSLFHVPVWRDVDLGDVLRRLRDAGHEVVVAAAQGPPCGPGWRKRPCALVLGSEAHGVSPTIQAAADRLIAVAGRGRAESLNVAMAATALLVLAEVPAR